jgi:ABC-type glycerol-3-phosphate transport system substrate-binding protein
MAELYNASSVINQPNDVYGFGTNGSDPHRLYKKILYFMWTNGGGVIDANGKLMLDNPGNVAGLSLYTNLSRTGIVETQRQIDANFAQGKVAFWISGGWLIEKIKKENPNLNYGVALLPGVTADQPGISFAGGEYLAAKARTKNAELAKKFIKFMTDGANALEFCKKVVDAGFPADSKYFNDPYYQSQPNRQVFAEQLKYARMTPVHPRWLEMESILEDQVVESLYARKSPAQAMSDAQSETEKMLRMK